MAYDVNVPADNLSISGIPAAIRTKGADVKTIIDTHMADTTDAHADSAISAAANGVLPAGTVRSQLTALDASQATAKTALADNDTFPLNDSVDANKIKKITIANVISGLKNYFDTLYLGKTATAAKATILATVRKINGVNFDGSADITIPTADATKLPLSGGTMTGVLTGQSTTGTIAATSALKGLEARGAGSAGDAAYMIFHRAGVFAAVFGLDTDNQLKYGGWSVGAVAHKIWHDGNTAGVPSQVISTTKSDTFSTTSASLVDVTGLSATITPSSASSKILVIANVMMGATGMATAALLRGTTNIGGGTVAGSRKSGFANFKYADTSQYPGCITFLDSPGTTAATTYKIQVSGDGSTLTVNKSILDSDTAYFARTSSSITLMEVRAND